MSVDAPAAARRPNRLVLLAGALLALPLVAVLYANLGRDPHLIRSPLVGKPAPPFSLPRLNGGPAMSLADLRGRPVVLNFWATWCVPCIQEHPALSQAARLYAPDVQFLGVVYDDQENNVRRFLEQHGAAFPTLLDPETRAAIAYGVQGVPETFFIDRQGVIVAKYAAPLDPATLATLLAQAGAQAPAAPAQP